MSTTPTVKPLKGKPTRAGWYWIRDSASVDPIVRFSMMQVMQAQACYRDDTLWYGLNTEDIDLLEDAPKTWVWHGPLTPPAAPRQRPLSEQPILDLRHLAVRRKGRVHSQGGTIDGAANLREHHFPGL